MQHYRSLSHVKLQNTWLTIGTFDGVHIGHQQIIRHLIQGSNKTGGKTVVVTFFPHPAIFLGKRENPHYLTSPEERARLLGEAGIDVVITIPFNEKIANQPPKLFVTQLKNKLGFTHLVVGPDFALGKDREGNVSKLQELSQEMGYFLDVLQPLESGGYTVSSSLVREALTNGEVEEASRLLGRPYLLRGRIVHGDGRGRSIGIPTANLAYWKEQALPKNGVYVCKAIIDGETWKSVVNIGYRPTFNDQKPDLHIEAHLIGFQGNIYGSELELLFIHHLRDEKRFTGIDELLAQIRQDINRAQTMLQD